MTRALVGFLILLAAIAVATIASAQGVPCCGPGDGTWRWYVIVPVAIGAAFGLVAWWIWLRGRR